jgi:hypothetical protein
MCNKPQKVYHCSNRSLVTFLQLMKISKVENGHPFLLARLSQYVWNWATESPHIHCFALSHPLIIHYPRASCDSRDETELTRDACTLARPWLG